MIEKLLCHRSKTLLDALQLFNENGKGAVFVVDDLGKVCGVLTDGDVRRWFLQGKELQSRVEGIIQAEFVFAKRTESREEIFNKLNEKIRILPIVDDAMRVVDYVEFRGSIHVPIASPDLKGNELKYLIDAFLSTWISSKGKYIERFEKEFARFIGARYAVANTNGTTSLHLALLACGIGPGDEVIVPDLTFAATINAVIHANARPVIVDVELDSWGIDPLEIEKAITSRTKAIIPVHLYGQPCNMGAIKTIARKHGLFVIEDCAEAHGALYGGQKVGSIGDIGCFSFFGNKVITCGEGGMCVTNNKEAYGLMCQIRDHGMSLQKRYWHDRVGYNYRMTNLQAAIGVAQLERVDEILRVRESLENQYRFLLADLDHVELQRNDFPDRKKITWLVSILVDRDVVETISGKLKERGFDVRRFFYPLSEMDIYKKYVFSNVNSRDISNRGLSLPTGAGITEKMVSDIVAVIKEKGASDP